MVPPHVPDCDIVAMDDGAFLVTHLGSGHVRTAANGRQALIVGTGLAIAYTWQTALRPCPPSGHLGPIVTDPATSTKKCKACGITVIWG
ncbi:hypothetical protein AB0F17_08090 [Nonomuraea sp. NPDC026600]|uniref:hypothetical protein n=1 Tax=Nonomuraea sp. NPDC026600 TaxID=3155363 RepID=UPI00340B1555